MFTDFILQVFLERDLYFLVTIFFIIIFPP